MIKLTWIPAFAGMTACLGTALCLTHCSKSPTTITASPNDITLQACFTPGEDCTTLLADHINAAQKSIEVQAYSFTSYPIAKALVAASARGVKVQLILDKSDFNPQYFSFASYFLKHGLTVYDDSQLNIAHNKVMIIDDNTVETGSFNFTKAAQAHNAENMLIVENASLAEAYLANWKRRQGQSALVPATKY